MRRISCSLLESTSYRSRGALANTIIGTIYSTHCRLFSTSRKNRIGFIGLGNMGIHMANNLLKAGHPLTVFDVSPKGIESIVVKATSINETVRVASSPADVSLDCRVIITMLPSSPQVLDVYTNERTGILAAFPPAKQKKKDNSSSSSSSPLASPLLIDSSTIDPATARYVAGLARDHGCAMVDAPVSGGIGGAESGTLTFMVGCADSQFSSVQPILSRMGRNIIHCGPTGTGQVSKVCNNLVLGITMIAVGEGMNLGLKLGMDPKKLAAIFNSSSARCWSSDTYNPVPNVLPNVPANREYEGGFQTQLMIKDLGLAIQAGKQAEPPIPVILGELAQQQYQRVKDQGWGQKDFSIVYQLYNRNPTTATNKNN